MIRPHFTSGAALLAVLLALSALAATPARAQGMDDDPVSFHLEFEPAAAGPGDVVTAKVVVEIAPPWHIYGLKKSHEYMSPTTVKLTLPEGWKTIGAVKEPPPEMHFDQYEKVDVPWHKGTTVFTRKFKLPDTAEPGDVTIDVTLGYMACTEMNCLDATTKDTTAKFTVLAEAIGTTATPEDLAEDVKDFGSEEEKEGFAGLVLAFLGGLGSILLPCVYPLIPLTVAFFSKHEGSQASAVMRATLFCVGILITFTVLGVALGPAIQALANSLWLNLFLFLLMLVLALSLLGWFDIQLPSSWTGKMQAAGGGASVLAPVAMGVAFSLASFSCTVGVIGPVLTGTSEWSHAASRMFSYSVGFALPFFVLALFPVLVARMPRGGGWMNTIKVMLGFFEICFAGYYLWKLDLSLGWGVGTYEVILAVWTVTVFLAGMYLLGKITLPHDTILERISVPRAMGAIIWLSAALILFGGLMGTIKLPGWMEGLLPPRTEEIVARDRPDWADEDFFVQYGGNWWTNDHDKALALGEETGRRVLLNFTGVFCTNCRTMEKSLFLEEAVKAEFDGMVLADLYTDIPNDEWAKRVHTPLEVSKANQKLRTEVYETAANPYYVILSPEGKVIARSGYLPNRAKFLEFLRTGK